MKTKLIQKKMEHTLDSKQTVSASEANDIFKFLYLVQEQTENVQDELERSSKLFQIGTKTELLKEIEAAIKNPVNFVLNTTSKLNFVLAIIVNKYVLEFMTSRLSLIKSVSLTSSASNSMHYSIVLYDDSFQNRDIMFEFFDSYDILDIADTFDVDFQFVPPELEEKINVIQPLILNNEVVWKVA